MNIITVIPFSHSKLTGELSYFTVTEVPIGAIVTVPVRSKKYQAIVVNCRKASDIKAEIKSADFQIRKLSEVKANIFLPENFIEACRMIAAFFAGTLGSIINTLIADVLLENSHKISPPLPAQASLVHEKTGGRIMAVQGDDADRLSSWRSLIRQEFATKKSVVMYVPTIEDCDRFHEALERGIEGYIFKLNGNLSAKTILSTWQKISELDHPVVVIATGSFSLLPRNDLGTVIIEKENGGGWITRRNPYIDLRQSLEIIATAQGKNLYLADNLLRTETLYRMEKEQVEQGSPFKWRSVSTARDLLVNMKVKQIDREAIRRDSLRQTLEERGSEIITTADAAEGTEESIVKNETTDGVSEKTPATERPIKSLKPRFQIISEELARLIKLNSEENTHLFILATRRGLSPTTVCDYCGTIVICNNCSAPVVLHVSAVTGKNFFMCHACGERRSAFETCVNCGSFHLTPLGIGIDRIDQELQKAFPNIEIFKVDSDTTKTNKAVLEVLEKFRAKPGSILLGTELALNRFSDKVDYSAIVSLDSLFALPDFRIQERIMYTLVRLRAQTIRQILVQSRRSEEKVFDWGLAGNLSDFYRANREERELYDYPPYSVLIKITIEGRKEIISKSMSDIQTLLTPYEVSVFPAFTSTVRGRSIIHGLIKISAGSWPDANLVSKLQSLPPDVTIKINPESLL